MIRDTTATLFGFYKFSAFDAREYRKARSIYLVARIISSMVSSIFLLVIIFILISPLADPNQSFGQNIFSEGNQKNTLFITLALPFSLAATMVGFSDNLEKSLSKVNADHLLSDFNLEKGESRHLAEDDIRENGYFSAKGYWELHDEEKRFDLTNKD